MVIDRGRYTDELVVEVELPDGVSPDASAPRRTRLRRRFKEVLMVRTVVRVIEPSIYDVQMFTARRDPHNNQASPIAPFRISAARERGERRFLPGLKSGVSTPRP